MDLLALHAALAGYGAGQASWHDLLQEPCKWTSRITAPSSPPLQVQKHWEREYSPETKKVRRVVAVKSQTHPMFPCSTYSAQDEIVFSEADKQSVRNGDLLVLSWEVRCERLEQD
eukprot:149197-Hanusia_phi.AAC.3